MGTISRLNRAWTNHVHLNSWRTGPSGQMASLIHRELESVSDSVGHLAWVQQKALEVQMDAHYRMALLQASANAELSELNARQETQNKLLLHVTTQLDSIASVLQAIDRGQSEQLQIAKAERTLKEVLFQLQTMLDEMIIPEDDIARLALCQIALDELDRHGLGTSHLSDLADKRVFAEFVKTTRQQIRNAAPEVQADLLAFETWYKGYKEAVTQGVPAFSVTPPPQWGPREDPQWHVWPEPAPPTTTPLFPPERCPPPGEFPSWSSFLPLPQRHARGGDFYTSTLFSPDNIPTKEETLSRFPDEQPKGLLSWVDNAIMGKEYENARRFEEAIRNWDVARKAYDAFVIASQGWQEKEAAALEKCRYNEQELYPRAQREYQRLLESVREEYEKAFKHFEESENERYREWQSLCEQHKRKEAERVQSWKDSWDAFQKALKSQAETINAFLEEHPDVTLIYGKRNWEEDIRSLRSSTVIPSQESAESDAATTTLLARKPPQEILAVKRTGSQTTHGLVLVDGGSCEGNKVEQLVSQALTEKTIFGTMLRPAPDIVTSVIAKIPIALPRAMTPQEVAEWERQFLEAGVEVYPFLVPSPVG